MWVKVGCPTCGEELYINIRMGYVVRVSKGIPTVGITDIEPTDTCTSSELLRDMIKTIKPLIKDGIPVIELHKMISIGHGLPEKYCYDILQKLKDEMELCCPDKEHLYHIKWIRGDQNDNETISSSNERN